MEDFIVIALLIVIVGLAAYYIYKAKKSGKKCIGCPYCDDKKNGGSCPCNSLGNKNK